MVEKFIIAINAICAISLVGQSLRASLGEGKMRLTDWLALVAGSVATGNTAYLITGNISDYQAAFLPLGVGLAVYLKYQQLWPRTIPWMYRKREERKVKRKDGAGGA